MLTEAKLQNKASKPTDVLLAPPALNVKFLVPNAVLLVPVTLNNKAL